MASQTTLLDVFDSFAGTVNTMLDIDRKEMERAAEMDVLNWQANFRVESDKFLDNLYRTTDENWDDKYSLAEQWDDRLTQFLTETRDRTKSANPYTQRQIEKMLTGYEATLRNDLRSKASAKMNEHAVLTMQDTADINRRTLSGQERINANGALYRQAYVNGTIDETNYRRLMLAETEQTVSDYYTDRVTELIDAALRDGLKSWESIEAEIRADRQSFTNLAGDQVDQDKFRDNSLKNGEKLYYARLGELQDKNANSLSEAFLRIVSMESASQQYTAARAVLADMDMTMGGNRLDESRRNSYARIFASFVDGYLSDQAKQAAASARASGSGNGTALSMKFSDYIKSFPETAVTQLVSGSLKDDVFYAVKDASVTALYEALSGNYLPDNPAQSVVWTENKKQNPYVAESLWTTQYKAQVENAFGKALRDRFGKDGDYSTVWNKFQNILDKAQDYDQTNFSMLLDYTIDLLASTPANRMNTIPDEMDKFMNACVYTQTRNKLLFPESPAARQESYADKVIANYAKAAAENDVVFTDYNGIRRIASGADVGEGSAFVDSQIYGVAKWLGLESRQGLSWQYEATDYDENTSVVVSYKGRNYKIEATPDGKDYQVFDVTGNKHEAVEDHRGVYAERREEKQNAVVQANQRIADTIQKQNDPEAAFRAAVYGTGSSTAQAERAANRMPKIVEDVLGREQAQKWNSDGYSYESRMLDVDKVINAIRTASDYDRGTYYRDMGILTQYEYADKNKIKVVDSMFNSAEAQFLINEGYLAEKDRNNTKKIEDARELLRQSLITGIGPDGSKIKPSDIFSSYNSLMDRWVRK